MILHTEIHRYIVIKHNEDVTNPCHFMSMVAWYIIAYITSMCGPALQEQCFRQAFESPATASSAF